MGKLGKFGSILNAMMGKHPMQDSNDVKGKDEGRETPIVFWGMSNPIFIPSKSQRVKSKILAKRNAKR